MVDIAIIYGLVALCLFLGGTTFYLLNLNDVANHTWRQERAARYALVGKSIMRFALVWPLVLPYFVWKYLRRFNTWRLKTEKRAREVIEYNR